MSSQHDEEAGAFAARVRPHLGRLYRLAYRLTGTVPDAEDLLQEVLCRLYERRDELDGIGELGPWLGRVLHNRFVDDIRRHARRRLKPVPPGAAAPADAGLEQLESGVLGPDAEAERSIDIRRLASALERLSIEHRTVLLMHDSEGYKLEEIQRITGVPLGTLKSRLHRARARLRELLGDRMEPFSGRRRAQV